MPLATKNEGPKCRKKPTHTHKYKNAIDQSRNSSDEKKNKKKKFLFVKFKGLGCKGTTANTTTSSIVSTPAIIRTAAKWEAKKNARKNHKRDEKNLHKKNRTSLEKNVVVDVPDVCCTPPGISIASDFAPRNRTNNVHHHRKHSREARRNEDFPAILSRINHQSAEEIIEMLMSQQPIPSRRILREHDEYQGWRLNVDDMSYEELLDLSDKIGYVGTGLQEEEISICLKKFKHFNCDSTSLLTSGLKDWKCTICQKKSKRDDEIVTLDCGHNHHVQCIKQWLRYKNACPVCKSAVMTNRSK